MLRNDKMVKKIKQMIKLKEKKKLKQDIGSV